MRFSLNHIEPLKMKSTEIKEKAFLCVLLGILLYFSKVISYSHNLKHNYTSSKARGG